jgi:hypothetical protein
VKIAFFYNVSCKLTTGGIEHPATNIEYLVWNLEFVIWNLLFGICYLDFGIWDFTGIIKRKKATLSGSPFTKLTKPKTL